MTKEELDDFIEDSKESTELSQNTLRVYRAVWRRFSLHLKQCGKDVFDESDVVAYMDENLGSHTSLANLDCYKQQDFCALNALRRFMRGEGLKNWQPLDYEKAVRAPLF